MNIIVDSDLITLLEDDGVLELKFKKHDFGKSFSSFMKQFPGYATDAVTIGADAISQYKTAKRITTRFFAKTPLQKQLYADVVKNLTKTGKFKQVTKKFMNGGIYYELVEM